MTVTRLGDDAGIRVVGAVQATRWKDLSLDRPRHDFRMEANMPVVVDVHLGLKSVHRA